MNTYASYRLHITPLSPVHIGTGESYEPTSYVIEDGVLHEFDTGAVVEALSRSDRGELLRIANGKPNQDMLKAVQRFFHERREVLKCRAINRIPVLPGVANLYAARVGRTAQYEGGGGQVVNRLEIDRTGYNPITRKSVLFGSSMKGSIRTALLDQVNGGLRASEKKGLHEFQGRLFRYRDPQRGMLNLELDPLRLLQLSDANCQGESDLPAAEVHLAVNRKKAPVVDEKGQLRKAMGENLYQILECVPAMRYRGFAGQLNLQNVGGLRDGAKLPAAEFRFSVEAIAHACNRFYLPVLTGERKLMRERGFIDPRWDDAVKNMLVLLQDKVRKGEAFLLRVGRHSGAESVTVSGARNGNIRIMKGKGQQPEFADAAKTLWLAADEKDQSSNLLPFGWLLVEVHPLDAPAPDWPELKAACEPHLAASRALAAKLERQRQAMEQVRAQAEAKRREEEEKARLKAEVEAQAAREEAERHAKLAAMTPEMQKVEEFRLYYGEERKKGRYQAGSQFDEKRRTFFREAVEWQEKCARQAAAALLRETIKEWTDWPSKKERKAEFRAWLGALENAGAASVNFQPGKE